MARGVRRCIGCGTRRAPVYRRLELEGIVSSLVCEECADILAAAVLKIAELHRLEACAGCSCTRSRCEDLRRAELGAPCCAQCQHYARME